MNKCESSTSPPRVTPWKHTKLGYTLFAMRFFALIAANCMIIGFWNNGTTIGYLVLITLSMLLSLFALLYNIFYNGPLNFTARKVFGGNTAREIEANLNVTKNSPDYAAQKDLDLKIRNNQWHFSASFAMDLVLFCLYIAFLSTSHTFVNDFQPLPVVYNSLAHEKYNTMKFFEVALAFASAGLLAFIMMETHSGHLHFIEIGLNKDLRQTLWMTEKIEQSGNFENVEVTNNDEAIDLTSMSSSVNPNNVLLKRNLGV